MDSSFNDPDYNMGNNNASLNHMLDTYRAVVDVIVPRTSGLAEEYGRLQYYGALDLLVEEYLILTLNYYLVPLAQPTVELLDAAAQQIITDSGMSSMPDQSGYSGYSTFVELPLFERFRVLTQMAQLKENTFVLPEIYQVDLELAITITNNLDNLTMMGYYSEWSGYGSTRLAAPNQRVLEYYPISWMQVGYPGPSLGYRALRAYEFE